MSAMRSDRKLHAHNHSRRTRQVAQEIKRWLVQICQRELSDPRLAQVGMITFSEVDLSPDYRNATVYVAFMGIDKSSNAAKEALSALQSASGFFHRSIMQKMSLRVGPRFLFKHDDLFDKAAVVGAALDRAKQVSGAPLTGDSPK